MRYAAFISYNHNDRKIAGWVHRQLENYRVPVRIQGRVGTLGVIGSRLPPIFRDREELAASADLAKSVREALAVSASLIVICSPNAAASRWVNEEVRTFRALGRSEQIQCVIVAGEPHASQNPAFDPALECFPPALFENAASEPLAADLRANGDGRKAAKLKLIAGILGVGYAELRDRETERNNRRLRLIAAASLTAFFITAGLAAFALQQRSRAIAERDIARQKTMTAERTVDFVESMFSVANPSEAKGQNITAREVLDRAARRMSQSLNEEPTVKAELTTTLSEVYGALGLFKQSDAMIQSTFRIAGRDGSTEARQLAVLGDAQFRLGNYKEAIATLKRALSIARNDPRQTEELPSRILVRMSNAHALEGDTRAAAASASEAISASAEPNGKRTSTYAAALEALADAHYFGDEFEQARPLYERAIAIRTATQGSLHPNVTESLNTLGNIAYASNDPVRAEAYFRRVVANDEVVLGPDHPDLAITINNLGRVLLEQRKFSEAATLLERATRITLGQREETHNDLAYMFDNLGIAKRYMGEPKAAEILFRKALRASMVNKHRNTAPVMTDLAELQCETGRASQGLKMLAEARPLMVAAYPDDPWRVGWLDNVRGECLIRAGQAQHGSSLITSTTKIVQSRWPNTSLYGYAVQRRLRSINATKL
jgi:tetratricopeptide (TPR) repeat protein